MKAKILFIIFNLILLVITESITILPWWSFLIVSLLMGLIFSKKNLIISPFVSGFISGFINWLSISLFFHLRFDGLLINKIVPIFYINTPLFFVLAGIIGGILNGLASYTGYCVLVKEDVLDLE